MKRRAGRAPTTASTGGVEFVTGFGNRASTEKASMVANIESLTLKRVAYRFIPF
jgi:hypothetical protein